MKIARLSGCKNFVDERERSLYSMRSLIFSQWRDLRMVMMCGFRSLNNNSQRVLDLLEQPLMLTVWKVMVERITVVKFRMDDGGGSGAGCFEIKILADTAKFTNVIVAIFRKCSDLVRGVRQK